MDDFKAPKDANDLLRNWPPPPVKGEAGDQMNFPDFNAEDQEYIHNLLNLIRDGKPYMIAVHDGDRIKYLFGRMSKREIMVFLGKINLQRAEKLQDE